MLELNNLSVIFNEGTVNEKLALDNINLTLDPGDFVTIIGSNGAGKSTLFQAISGAVDTKSGSIILNGKDITFEPEYRRSRVIGRLFQDPMLGTASEMQILENLALAKRRGKHRGLSWGVSKNEKDEYYELVKSLNLGLENRLTTKVGLLSGGQRQAVTLLMATLQKPKLLLLDEHTAALDPATSAKVLSLTEKIVNEQNLTAMMVTHNMKDAIDIGNRLIMMYDGHIIYDVKGEEKRNLKVSDLLKKFEEASGEEFVNDRMLLG